MTIALIALFAAVTVLMFYQMITPFLVSREDQLRYDLLDDELRKVEELSAQKTLYVENLREIQNDYELDKISEGDYLDLKRRYERASILVMRQLDELHGGRGWEARVDDALTEDPALAPTRTPRLERDEAPKKSETRSKQDALRSELRAAPLPAASDEQTCHACGKPLDAEDRFCSQCGASVDTADSADSAAE